jgi:NADH dehydrogenase [ubiquinone] 1 alpha subcomplex assembly factor 7
MTCDPGLRRDTPLALILKQRIREHGPMPVREFIGTCLTDPAHGYYRTRDAIGRSGDFITAPEISQVFGELIGLWCVVVWQQMGSPSTLNLIEIGPGRATMLRDALRAAERVPGFLSAVRVGLIEPSEVLRAIQSATLADLPVGFTHLEPTDPPPGPTILLANEVLDCIPIDQLVCAPRDDGIAAWFIRTVELDAHGALQFGRGRPVERQAPSPVGSPRPGDILEGSRTHLKFETMGRDYASTDLAALFIDYGDLEHGVGDTLQAVRHHTYEHPLASPGEADLTAHVDFAHVAKAATQANFAVDGPVTQAEFLGSLGITERASRLMAANPSRANGIEMSIARLMAPNGMGTRFKALGLRSPHLPPLPGFPAR